MAKLAKSNNRRKNTKIIDKQRIIEIMKSNINPKTNNPNYSKVCNLTGVDRKTLARWWDKREKIATSLHKNNRNKLSSAKFKGMFPEMEDKLDEWTEELRAAGCCISGFTLKVKALQILRENDQYNGAFTASEGWLRGFLRRKNYALRRITTTGRDLPSDFLETIVQFHKDCEINFIDDDEFDANALINMDETSVYVDKPSNYTYAKKVNINQVYSAD
jgi:hypothetical protein